MLAKRADQPVNQGRRVLLTVLLLNALIVAPLCLASSHAGYDSAISMIGGDSGEANEEGWGPGITHRHSSPSTPHLYSSTSSSTSRCIDIPANFTLCHGIQYRRMHLPNLLDHETIDEALEQSNAWVSLLRLHCHAETRLFLCSLFAPVCLDDAAGQQPGGGSLAAVKIQPCRSLCAAVKSGCEERMAQYGFPWPEILRCEKFPTDNDMCIRLPTTYEEGTEQSTTTTTTSNSPHSHRPDADSSGGRRRGTTCKSCAQVSTFENLMDSYCRSAIVLKGRLRLLNGTHALITRRSRVFKGGETLDGMKHHGSFPLLPLAPEGENCECPALSTAHTHNNKAANYLIMAGAGRRKKPRHEPSNGDGVGSVALLLVPWQAKDKGFKSAVRRFRKLNCQTLGREIRESMLATGRQHPFRRTIFR